MFGRASDLTLVLKQNLSVSANNVVFLHLVRMKTSVQTASFNASESVLEVLLAHFIKHYPSIKNLDPDGLAVTNAGSSHADLLSWLSALQAFTTCAQDKQDKQANKNVYERSDLDKHKAAVIEQLLAVNETLAGRLFDRLDAIEFNTQEKKRRCSEDEVEEE